MSPWFRTLRLLLRKTVAGFFFPAPGLRGSQIPAIPAPRGVLSSAGLCPHHHIHVYTRINIKQVLGVRKKEVWSKEKKFSYTALLLRVFTFFFYFIYLLYVALTAPLSINPSQKSSPTPPLFLLFHFKSLRG